ncbi:MAG: PAS domain-containing protein [Anaerolineales bacterium]|nr:PAS domain-containing protein [Anaerolineales bacterium]
MKRVAGSTSGLGTKLTISFLLLSILPLFLITYLAYFNNRNIIKQETFNRLIAINLYKHNVLNRWIHDQEKSLDRLSRRTDFIHSVSAVISNDSSKDANHDAYQGIIDNHLFPLLDNEGFLELDIMDSSSGIIRISTDKTHEGENQQDWNYYIVGKSRLFFNLAYNTPSPGETTMTISAPIQDQNGQTIAVIVGRLNQDVMGDIMMSGSGLIETEETFLINNLKNLVTIPPLAKESDRNLEISTVGGNDCLENKSIESAINLYNDYRGVPVIGAYRWLPEFEVCIITEVDQKEAFKAINNLRNDLFSLSIIVAFFVSAIGYALSQTLFEPVDLLVKGAREIGKGKLDHRIEIETTDEIGQLAGALNQMAADLDDMMEQRSQGQRVMRALSQAAQAVQNANTIDEIFQIIGGEIELLGYNAFIFTLTEDRKNLNASYYNIRKSLPEIAEKTLRNIPLDATFPIMPGDLHYQVIYKSRTIFSKNMIDYIQNAFPRIPQFIIQQLVKDLGMEQGIYAPLRIGDDAQGILLVAGSELTEAEMPAVTALANQTAIALLNMHSKQAQRSLETRLEYLLASSPAVIYSCKSSPPFKMTYISENVQDLLGFESWEFTEDPKFIRAHIHQDDEKAADCEFPVELERGSIVQEFRFRHKDGAYHWLHDTKRLIKDSQGNPQEIVGSWIDITDRKHAEESHMASERKLAMAQKVAKIGSWEYDFERNTTTWSDETFRQMGLEPGEITPTYEYLIDVVHPEDKKILTQAVEEAVQYGKSYAIEVRMIRPDNTEWILFAQGNVQKNEQGIPIKFFGTHQDVTEINEIREKLAKSQKLALLGQLAGGVGHELRDPLGNIKNAVYYLDMLLNKSKNGGEIIEMLDILKHEIGISERLISSLLDFTRSKQTRRKPTDINRIVRETLDRIEKPDDIEVTFQADEKLAPIEVDPDQLGIILRNIMCNAIEAMTQRPGELADHPNSGGKLDIKTEFQPPNWIAISISDTGIGISQETLGKIFDPLFTTKKEGIGLGMAIAKTLVTENNGEIKVNSQVGIGTTFTVRLSYND